MDSATHSPARFAGADGRQIAYHSVAGKSPGVVFCGGYASDMQGTKASALDRYCRTRGRAFTRFDYTGHGASDGAFVDGTIGSWRDDTLAVIDRITSGPLILVGSSMGAWLACLAATARPDRIAGLVTIGAAPDFTERLLRPSLSDAERAALAAHGQIRRPSDYGEAPGVFTARLIEDGQRHQILGTPLAIACPVRLLHGTADKDVPWSLSLALLEALGSADATLTLVKDGDHRLSDGVGLAQLTGALDELVGLAG